MAGSVRYRTYNSARDFRSIVLTLDTQSCSVVLTFTQEKGRTRYELGLIGEDLKNTVQTSNREGPNDGLASLTHDRLPTVARIQLGGLDSCALLYIPA